MIDGLETEGIISSALTHVIQNIDSDNQSPRFRLLLKHAQDVVKDLKRQPEAKECMNIVQSNVHTLTPRQKRLERNSVKALVVSGGKTQNTQKGVLLTAL